MLTLSVSSRAINTIIISISENKEYFEACVTNATGNVVVDLPLPRKPTLSGYRPSVLATLDATLALIRTGAKPGVAFPRIPKPRKWIIMTL